MIYLLNATLPLHVVGLGGSKTQVGLLFATSTTVSMVLRPLVGGWVDRFGARRVMLPGRGGPARHAPGAAAGRGARRATSP